MIRHVVMFTWADGVDDAHVAATRAALSTMPDKIDSIRSYVHGPDARLALTNADYVLVADFDDEAGFVTYRDHPDHIALVQQYIAGHTSGRLAVQHLID